MTENQITFEAAEVSGSTCEGCFQAMLDSRKESDELITSFKNYDWDAPYLLIQRVFPEEDEANEEERLYVETHRAELSGHVSRLEVSLAADTFVASWDKGTATIRLDPTDRDLQEFLQVLRIIVPGAAITGNPSLGSDQ